MEKILHITVVLLGVLWLVTDLYALKNNGLQNNGSFDFLSNNPYSSEKAKAPLGTARNSNNIGTVQSPAVSQLGGKNGNQSTQNITSSNQITLEKADTKELQSLMQFLLSAINSMNKKAQDPENEYVMTLTIKNTNPAENQTEREIDIKRDNPATSDDIEFENFSEDEYSIDDEYYEDDDKDEASEMSKPINKNLTQPSLEKVSQNPENVNKTYLLNNFSSILNTFSNSPYVYNPPVKTERNETYYSKNIPGGITENEQTTVKPLNSGTPPNIGNSMYDPFIPYTFQKNTPQNVFPSEYIPSPNQFANTYLVPNPFPKAYSNFPVDQNIHPSLYENPTNPQALVNTQQNKLFDPYIQYNQRYIPRNPYLSEYIPFSDMLPEWNRNNPDIASSPLQNVPESQNPAVNPAGQFNAPPNLEVAKTDTGNNLNTNYGFQPIDTNNQFPLQFPIVPRMFNTQNNENRPQENEKGELPSDLSQNVEQRNARVQLNRNISPNLTDFNSNIPGVPPTFENETATNSTVADQASPQTDLNENNNVTPGGNSTMSSVTNPTSQQENKFVTEQIFLNQAPNNSSNSDDFPKNQSLSEENITSIYPKENASQLIKSEMLPRISSANKNSTSKGALSTTNPEGNVTGATESSNVIDVTENSNVTNVTETSNVTDVVTETSNVTDVTETSNPDSQKDQQNVTSVVLLNITEVTGISNPKFLKEQQALTPAVVKMQTASPEDSSELYFDSDDDNDEDETYVDDNYYDDENLKGFFDLLQLMQEMMSDTTPIPQNSSYSTISDVSPLTPGSNTTEAMFDATEAPQNATGAPQKATEDIQNALTVNTNSSNPGLLNPANSINTTENFKPRDTFDSILEYILKYSNNPLFMNLRDPQNGTTQN